MSEVRAAFATYFKAERDRCEATLVDIVTIVSTPGRNTDEAFDAILARLEAHYGRYQTTPVWPQPKPRRCDKEECVKYSQVACSEPGCTGDRS